MKLDRYRLYGIPEYWIVDPETQTIEVWALARGAIEPIAHGQASALAWTPIEGRPTLALTPAELFAA